jgi:hypothetical protein
MQVFNFGTVAAQLDSIDKGSSILHAAQARLKFSNPGKLQCTVTFTITPLASSCAATSAEVCPFSSDVDQISIPATQDRFVTISFLPRQIASYRAKFEAMVNSGSASDFRQCFTCDVKVCAYSFITPHPSGMSAGHPLLKSVHAVALPFDTFPQC